MSCQVSKHLIFSFWPSSVLFPHTVNVFALDGFSTFAVLQSRVHEPWARLLSSSLEDRLRYTASDCFETFPFPRSDPRAVLVAIEASGRDLLEARSRFMGETNQGLTKTYNALKDAACADERVLELRALHEAMDRVVVEAYGWDDLTIPPYCPLNDAQRAEVRAFQEAVVDRLFVLNAERAAEERAVTKAPPTAREKDSPKRAPKRPRRSNAADSQGALPGLETDDA